MGIILKQFKEYLKVATPKQLQEDLKTMKDNSENGIIITFIDD